MEGITVERARKIFGANFFGLEELASFITGIGLKVKDVEVPHIYYLEETLIKCAQDYILILGLPEIEGKKITISMLRNSFGVNPDDSEPCFYNQDWYLQEEFIQSTLDLRWYLLKKDVMEDTRSVQPSELLNRNICFPSAILCIYTFFVYYYVKKEYLWIHDFIWCSDLDHNGDRIYVGKYHDVDGINKNGISIHRHLALRNCYTSINIC